MTLCEQLRGDWSCRCTTCKVGDSRCQVTTLLHAVVADTTWKMDRTSLSTDDLKRMPAANRESLEVRFLGGVCF